MADVVGEITAAAPILVPILEQLSGTVLALIERARTAKAEEHAAIVDEMDAAIEAYNRDVDAMPAVLAANNAAADDASTR